MDAIMWMVVGFVIGALVQYKFKVVDRVKRILKGK